MLRAFDFLGALKWPSLLLTVVATLIAFPYWEPVQRPYALLETVTLGGIDIGIYGRRADESIELRLVSGSTAASDLASLEMELLSERGPSMPLVAREEYGALHAHLATGQRSPVLRLRWRSRLAPERSHTRTTDIALPLTGLR